MLSKFPNVRDTRTMQVMKLRFYWYRHSANTKYNHFELVCKQQPQTPSHWNPKSRNEHHGRLRKFAKKHKRLHEAAQLNDSQPTPENITNFGNTRDALKETYEAEQLEDLKRKINHITNAVNNQRSAIAWKTVDEISGRKSSNRSKLKASNQDKRVKFWQQHSQDLLGKPPITPVFTEEKDFSLWRYCWKL